MVPYTIHQQIPHPGRIAHAHHIPKTIPIPPPVTEQGVSPYRSGQAASAEENGFLSKSFIFRDVVKKVWRTVGVLQYRCL